VAPTLTILAPILRVPEIAADAATIGVSIVGTAPPIAFRYRLHPYGETPGEAFEKTWDPISLVREVYFTWEGLEENVAYVVDVEADDSNGATSAVTETFTFATAGLYPEGSQPREWAFNDFAGQWKAMLAWYMQKDPLTDTLFKRIGREFQRLDSALEQGIRYTFPAWAYGEGLAMWEALYGITLPTSLSDDLRRALILVFQKSRTSASAAQFVDAIAALQGGVVPDVTLDYAEYTVYVTLAGSAENQAVVKELIERIKPAHLLINYSSRNLQFSGRRRLQMLGGVPHRAHSAIEPTHRAFNFGRLS
jgi:hypothetical protein